MYLLHGKKQRKRNSKDVDGRGQQMIDGNNFIVWFTFAVTIFGGLGTILGFWNKWVYTPAQERREKKQAEQSQDLINTIKEVNEPHLARMEKLEELTERSLEMHEKHEENFQTLDKRVFVLEKKSPGEVKYTEIYEGGNV